MKTILKTLVGSRAHGLHNADSDYDWRGVFVEELVVHLSPFQKTKNNHWIEGDQDDTSYELTHFIKGCCQCNPNFLEVVYSPGIEFTSPIGEELIKNRSKFLDTQRIFDSHRGYAQNQYKKMNLFEPDARTPKFAVAYIRALHNGAQLLRDGTMEIKISDQKFLENLRTIKYDFDQKLAAELFNQKSKEIIDAMAETKVVTSDTEFWENFILNHYTG